MECQNISPVLWSALTIAAYTGLVVAAAVFVITFFRAVADLQSSLQGRGRRRSISKPQKPDML